MNYLTTQKEFFQKLDTEKYREFENNLCGIINIFLVLKDLGSEVSEQKIFDKALKINAFDVILWWKHDKLMLIFSYFCYKEGIAYRSAEVFDWKFLHNRKMKKIFFNFDKQIYIASIKLDENHLIIIDRVEYNNIYYSSVWTKEFEPVENKIIKIDDFFEVYNKRGILIKL